MNTRYPNSLRNPHTSASCGSRLTVQRMCAGFLAGFVLLAASPANAQDAEKIKMDEINIFGTREAPSVHYVVPWSEERSNELYRPNIDRPKHDFGGLDRVVLQREVQFHDAQTKTTTTPPAKN